METVTIKKKRVCLSYEETLAWSLVRYAKGSSLFYKDLQKLISPRLSHEPLLLSQKIQTRLSVLKPSSKETAMRRALWLKEKEAAQDVFATLFDEPFASPKQIVIGIAVGIIPGVTLGKFPRRKIMTFICEAGGARPKIEVVTALSHEVLLRSLFLVGGDAQKLDPDTHEWFFDERALTFYKAKKETLAQIKSDLRMLGIPYAFRNSILAISPAVEHLPWNIEPLIT